MTFYTFILTLAVAVSAHIAHGAGTKKAKDAFVGGVLLLMMATQCYYLILSSVYIPNFPHMYNEKLIRYGCLDSGKGGKRPGDAKKPYDLNPCFCHANAVCTLDNGTVIDSSLCPLDGATCMQGWSANGTEQVISPYVNEKRNCQGGAGIQCSKEQPCDP